MGFEPNPDYPSDLDKNTPVGGVDHYSTVDEHLRNIKRVITTTLANVTGAITANQAELNILTGATVTTAELNTLDGILSTVDELNLLNGVSLSLTATELNLLIGLTAAAAEINTLDGYTGDVTDLNKLAGVTSSAAELNILDGADITITPVEINTLQGLTATTAELNILDGVTATNTEVNLLAGLLTTNAELNFLQGATSNIQSQLTALDAKADGTNTLTAEANKGLSVSGGGTLDNNNTLALDTTNVPSASDAELTDELIGARADVPHVQTLQHVKTLFNIPTYPPGLVCGCSVVGSGDDCTIQPGYATDTTNQKMINLTSALTKEMDAAWTDVGNGGFPTGITRNALTWYQLFLIMKEDGTINAGYDTSDVAANLLLDATDYVYYRRVAWVYNQTVSAMRGFRKQGDIVLWTNPALVANHDTVGGGSVDYETYSLTGYVPPRYLDIVAKLYIWRTGSVATGWLTNGDNYTTPSSYVGNFTGDEGVSHIDLIMTSARECRVEFAGPNNTITLGSSGYIDFNTVD